ncbi:MAG: protein kinase domain-containing protein [Acidobacteriota bacterium]
MTLAPGTRLGSYEITAKLGEGGMGEVFRARDLRLGREVAIKVLPADLAADPVRAARFEREAKLLAQLNHPNVAQIYGYEAGPQTPALVMELVEGTTLSERLARGALSLVESLAIARQIAEALEEAHEKGIVHRDLKPQNVMLTAGGRVKVLDFGLAKALAVPAPSGAAAADLAQAPTLSLGDTRQGVLLGTASYMAPEQARGGEVDRRADIWSFGVVLYEMLSGARLFIAPSFVETLSAVLHQPIDLDRLPAPSPARLRELVGRCLERDPRRRLRDIGEARLALEGLAAAPPEPATAAPGALPLPSVAVLPFVNMSADPENEFFADGITEDVIAHLAKIRTLRVTSRTSAMTFKRSAQSLREIGAALGVAALVEGSVRRAGQRVRIVAQLVDPRSDRHLWAETYDREIDDIFAIQTDVALQIATALRAELTLDERQRIGLRPTRDLEAYQLYLQGRHRLVRFTREAVTQSLAFFEQAVARDPGFALAHAAIAHAHTQLGIEGVSGVVPAEAFARAQAAVDRALALDDGLAEAHGVVGLLRFTRDFDWPGAEAELRLALRLSPGSADIYDHLGWLCSAQGRFDESLALVRRAREIDPVMHRSDVANELMRAGRVAEALAEAERSIAVDPSYSRSQAVFGWACLALGRTAEGLAAIERAVELSPGSTLFLAQLGQACAMTGDQGRARAILAELEALAAKQYVASYHLAHVHTGLGEQDAAIDRLERAYEQRSGGIYGVKGSYLFASLREHPRFQALLKRMNL